MTDAPPLRPGMRPGPRIETENRRMARVEAVPPPIEDGAPASRRLPGGVILLLSGFSVLALGLAALQVGNFVAAQFTRAAWLGWLTLAVAVTGFGLVLAGIFNELRGLAGLHAVDRLRADLASENAHRRLHAARLWLSKVEGGAAYRPAIDAQNDPDAVLALLRAGLAADLRARADALGRRAALQIVAGLAATPAPSLVVLLIAWRATRLIRQIATVYGLRPGFFATLGLLRRTALSASATAVTEAAVNTAAHAVLSSPLLAHVAGDMAGGAVAARRMIVLGRAAQAACSPLQLPSETEPTPSS
ncbi:DUF697 domain-containing protein [Acidomonas methanolica]|uniref:DUF697 domain-containing protein n=1 Tax=Acidomonas methanolica TaxID=437 RepID=UPI002119EB89|nr:DUF697 domain-containing protein [Acidomonas methanolica]